MLENAIKGFYKQLEFEPKIENQSNLKESEKYIVAGMGGSHLGADLIACANPSLSIEVHHDYNLPKRKTDSEKNRLIIASSYSGNTEEVISSLNLVIQEKIPGAAISIGGKLLEIAKNNQIPYIKIPDTGIQPRSAVGFSVVGILALMKEIKEINDLKSLASKDTEERRKEGESIAESLKNKIPIIYSSTQNEAVAANWKIRINETGKIPSFWNTIPEANHNELIGFERHNETAELSSMFGFIFLKDNEDHERINRRMEIQKSMYEGWGYKVQVVELQGKNRWEKILSSIVLADWTAYHMSETYKLEPEEVETVERFKKLLG